MCPAFYKNSRSSQQTAPVPFRKRDRSCFFASLHGACQERGDLRSRAGGGGVEVTAAHAGGDAVLHGPRHGLRVVAVSGDVGKARRTARHRLARGPPQHRHHLGAVDGGVGVRAVGNALVLGPILCLFVPDAAAGQVRVILPREDRPKLRPGGGVVGRVDRVAYESIPESRLRICCNSLLCYRNKCDYSFRCLSSLRNT